MSNDDSADPTPAEPAGTDPVGATSSDEATDAQLDAYDLDGDGKISIVENERARLGLVDARLEEIAEQGGVKGKLAEAAHKVLDEFDND
ncbi:MAG: hypothetical protein HKN44_15475 [Ilumatobacter sp.]|nr:hypothetical protein [Ilumatobacter sp.]